MIAQERLGPGRIYHCVRWLGICERAFDLMCTWAASRNIAPDKPLSTRQIIQALRDGRLGTFSKVILVGHSLGSFVVQEVALRHPEMVDAAILVATSTTCVGNPVLRDFVLAEPVEGSWKANLVSQGFAFPDDVYGLTPVNADPYGSPLYMRDAWVADPVADPAFLAPYIPETEQVRLGTWIGASRALLQTDNTARLRDLDVPTMVIWATQDSIFLHDPDQTAIQAALSAAATAHHRLYYWKQYGIRPLPPSGNQESDIGHNVQWGAPDSVAADIDYFLRHGVPDPDLTHSDAPPNIRNIVVEPGKAIIVTLGG